MQIAETMPGKRKFHPLAKQRAERIPSPIPKRAQRMAELR